MENTFASNVRTKKMKIPKVTVDYGEYIDLRKTPDGNLEITPTEAFFDDIEYLEAREKKIGDITFDLMESHLCNGWTEVSPEEIGVLTSGEIISDDFEYIDDGDEKKYYYVYWNSNYQTEDFFETLKRDRKVVLIGCKIDYLKEK